MAFSQADFSDSLGNGHEHDIHVPDAAPVTSVMAAMPVIVLMVNIMWPTALRRSPCFPIKYVVNGVMGS